MFMFKRMIFVFMCLLLCAMSAFAVIDSAAVVNGVTTAGTIANAIANASGHSAWTNVISTVVTCVCSILAFIFGHSHGKRTVIK